MGFENDNATAEPAPASAPAPAAAQVKPSDPAERAKEAERGRLRRAKAKLAEAKDEAQLKKAARELVGGAQAPALAPTLTPEKVAELLHKAILPSAPILGLAAEGSEEVWADALRSLSSALGDNRGKALCAGWAELIVHLFPNGLDNPYAAAVLSTIVFSLGVGVQTVVVRKQREGEKKASETK